MNPADHDPVPSSADAESYDASPAPMLPSGSAPRGADTRDARLARVAELVRAYLGHLCSAARDEALERLAEDEDMLGSTRAVRLAVYRSLRTLKAHGDSLQFDFLRRLTQRIHDIHALPVELDPPSRALRFMSEEDLEQGLLCATFVAQVDAITRAPLDTLAAALGSTDANWNERVRAALGPRAVLDAYLHALTGLALEPEVRLVLLRALHAQMLEGLPRMYQHCVQAATAAGQALLAHADANHDRSPDGRGLASPEPKPLLATALQRMAGSRATDAASQATSAHAPMLDALWQLQQELATAPEGPADTLARLVDAVRADTGQERFALGTAARALIDLVEVLFELMLEEPGFPSALGPQLMKLRIPMLRLTLHDRSLLLRREAPARQLLEALARAALEFEDGSLRQAEILACCRRAIDRVMLGYREDARVFDSVLADFQREQSQLQQKWQQIERVVGDQDATRPPQRAAWREVANLLRSDRAQGELPPLVHELLRKPWAQYMALLAQRHGAGSDELRGAADVAHSLRTAFAGWALLPSCRPARAQQAMHELASHAIELRSGLERVGYTPRQVLDTWRKLTRLIVEGSRPDAEAMQVPCESAVSSVVDPSFDDSAGTTAEHGARSGDAAAAPTEAMRMPAVDAPTRALAVGDQVLLHAPDAPPTRLKLCWRGVASGWHVFVNGAGVKALELPGSRVQAMLVDGRLERCS